MVEPLSWESLAQPASVVAAVSLLLMICKAALGMYWNTLINGIGALVFGIVVSVGIAAAIGLEDPQWLGYVLAGLNGIVYAGAVLGVNQRFSAKVEADKYRMKR